MEKAPPGLFYSSDIRPTEGSALLRLIRDRSLAQQIVTMHSYRHNIKAISREDALDTPIADPGSFTLSEVLPLIEQIQDILGPGIALAGGWGTLAHLEGKDRPRLTSSDVDFLAESSTAFKACDPIGLKRIVEWGSYVGFVEDENHHTIRVEVNPVDIFKEREMITISDGGREYKISVASALTIVIGKLARTYFMGPQSRDQVDIALLLLKKPSLPGDLKAEMEKDPLIRTLFDQLDLPASLQGKIDAESLAQLTLITEWLKSHE